MSTNAMSAWQDLAAVGLAVAAAAYLIRRVWRSLDGRSKTSRCGSTCAGCSKSPPPEQGQIPLEIVSITHPVRR